MPSEPNTSPSPDFVPLCIPEIRGNEWQYIKECLDTNWVSSVGSFVDRFEGMLADYVGAPYSVATINGTAADGPLVRVVDLESRRKWIVYHQPRLGLGERRDG